MRALIDLGFEARPAKYGVERATYRFAHLELDAWHGINRHFQQTVFLSGVLFTGRALAEIDSEIPNDIQTKSIAAAWVSYTLRSCAGDLGPLPDWMIEGQLHWSLLPFVRDAKAYQARPQCTVDRDFARTLLRKLRDRLSGSPMDVPVRFRFDGSVLSIEIEGTFFGLVGSGTAWPMAYEVKMGPRTRLPTRFKSPLVDISFWDGHVRFGGWCYQGQEIPI